MLSSPPEADAQQQTTTDALLELYSEMWAMAGICSQYPQFRVNSEDLATRLNTDISRLAADQQHVIVNRKNEKLEEISVRVDELEAMPRGGDRNEAVEDNTAALLTRCQRLANHSLARDYFSRRPG
ncbi:hypothetical protein OZN62_13535 [Aurantiacibacter sp. MUD11]|uniref:hypothetical protein n=1 Tax=Aurantiacibacter sp. MUD11 TaxID=3003265 RepID=UPI0022AA29BF|nr:hypothetical protein [Aurantiacibacter sp. MUD11]WAT17919.1 hypothetical protein OZN62_13535 [Aurantiacibacter sp. MUD11]